MARKRTIGINPLDAVVPIPGATAQTAEPARTVKERATFQLPAGLIERARNAVYWTPGATMAGLMETALSAYLDHLESQQGKAFPERGGALKTGRPVK